MRCGNCREKSSIVPGDQMMKRHDPADDIVSLLNTTALLAHFEYHEEITSTNDRALRLAAHPEAKTPLLVFAERQHAGRGRGNHRWHSSAGSLTFSLLLETAGVVASPEQLPFVSLCTGLAVCEALEPWSHGGIGLKWPNDVWIGGRKVCGILVEVPPQGRSRVVVGIGVNVNTEFREAPPDVQRRGTSLQAGTGTEIPRTAVLANILKHFFSRWYRIPVQMSDLPDQWRRYCVLQGETIQAYAHGRAYVGQCLGIDPHGALQIHTDLGIVRLYAGEVEPARTGPI